MIDMHFTRHVFGQLAGFFWSFGRISVSFLVWGEYFDLSERSKLALAFGDC